MKTLSMDDDVVIGGNNDDDGGGGGGGDGNVGSMMIMFDKELLDQSGDLSETATKLNQQNLVPCSLCERKFLSDRLVSVFYFSYLNLDIFIIFFPTFETKNLDDLTYKSINPKCKYQIVHSYCLSLHHCYLELIRKIYSKIVHQILAILNRLMLLGAIITIPIVD